MAEPTDTPTADDAHARRVAALKAAPEGAQVQYQGQLYTKSGNQLVPVPSPSPTPNAAPTPATRGWTMELLPVGGALAGGMVGAGSPIPGGAAMGAGLGSMAGESAAQLIEGLRGQRQEPDLGATLRTGVEQGAMEMVGGPVFKALGRGVEAAAPRVIDKLLPRSAYEARMVQGYRADVPFWQRIKSAVTGTGRSGPRTVAQTAVEQGIRGTETGIGIQSKRAEKALWDKTIGPALRQSPERVKMADFFDEVEKKIIHDNPELARQQDLVEALGSLRDSYKNVTDIPIEQLQKLKRGWSKFVPEKAYQGKPIAGAFNDVKDTAADLARDKIYGALGPDVRQAYFDYGNLIEMAEHGQRVMTGGLKRGGFGGMWSAIKDQAITPVSTIGAQVVYKTGQGLKLIGAPGARVVRDIIAGVPEVGRSMEGGASRAEAQPLPGPEPSPTPPPVSADAIQAMREKPLGHVLDRWRDASDAEKAQFRPVLMTRLMRGELIPKDRDQLRAALMPNSLPEVAPTR